MILQTLQNEKKISPPKWLIDNTIYLTLGGSHMYGCNREDSDKDVWGIVIPKKDILFPAQAGFIPGYDEPEKFDQWQHPHIIDSQKQEWDFTVYNIVRWFFLAKNSNPNLVELPFADRTCVIHNTAVGELIRQNRKLFLCKEIYFKLKAYAGSQWHKVRLKNPQEGSKRAKLIEDFGVDTKYLYNLVRLMLQCEQILTYGDMDLRRDRETYKEIRRGERTVEDIEVWFKEKEKYIDKLYHESKAIPERPREQEIKQLLLSCLEHHYGSLEKCVANLDKNEIAIQKIKEIVGKL